MPHTDPVCPAHFPTIHIISDSVGVTAQGLARAAATQFGAKHPHLETLAKAQGFHEIERFLLRELARYVESGLQSKLLVYYTLVDRDLRQQVKDYIAARSDIIAVDLLGDALEALSAITGCEPIDVPGSLRVADESYFNRIAAMEFTIAHDDGKRAEDLPLADIILLGVSRSSKTPTSIYLSQQGYKVANIPLDPKTTPPDILFQCDPTRIFGLVTTPDVLVSIRSRRLGDARGVAQSYADPEAVYADLEQARQLMRKLGCIVVHTENRAIEETAQEILRYFEMVHPPTDIS